MKINFKTYTKEEVELIKEEMMPVIDNEGEKAPYESEYDIRFRLLVYIDGALWCQRTVIKLLNGEKI